MRLMNKLNKLKILSGKRKKNVAKKKILHHENEDIVEENESDEEISSIDKNNENDDVDDESDDVNEESNVEYDTEQSQSEDDGVDNDGDDKKILKKRNYVQYADEEVPRKKIKKENNLYKPPTVDELNQLRETENLFHSNLFRLQIDEILAEVKLKEKYKKLLSIWFTKFKENVESLKETNDQELCKLSLKKLKAKIPKLNVPENEKGFFKFLKPSKISIIGSYSLNTLIGPNITVDIMVEMPAEFFQKHDYQNYRYLRKRAIYLAYIASNLKSDLADTKTFIGESWMPKLKIIPSGSLSKRVIVHVLLSAESTSFKFNRFLPEKNSIRPNWYFNSNNDNDSDTSGLIPTPLYNSNILHDLTMAQSHSQCEKIISEYPNLRDGIILLKIWLRQRQPENSYDGFNGHIITVYVLHLLFEKKLNTFMSSYQIIRNVWNNLAQTNWSEAGISACQEADSKIRAKEYGKYYDCTFLDSSGYHNCVANIPLDNYLWIRSEAELAVKCLDNPNIDSFQVLFMKRLPFYSSFDHSIYLHDTVALREFANELDQEQKLDFGVNARAKVIKRISEILKQGLGERVLQVYIKPDQYKEWNLDKNTPVTWKPILIGLELNSASCFNVIDKGPPANLPEAETFRKFWGQKSELRRFQDGSICEAVVWGKEHTLAEKRMICKKIIMYLLKTKLDLSKHQYSYGGNEIEECLRLQKTVITKFNYGTGEEASLQVIKAFNDLEKQLLALTDLPLSITGIQPCSPVLRYTDVFPPLATVYKADEQNTRSGKRSILLKEKVIKEAPKYAPLIEATIQLSTSGKWPDELEAVRKTKAAFHIHISECIRKEHNYPVKASMHHIDIFYEGFVFRFRIAHQKEIALLKQVIDEAGVKKYRDNDESIELEQTLFHLPKLNGALYGLHSQQPSFGPTCCLAKRWLSAQLLDSSHIPDTIVEFIIAYIYLSPEPHKPAQMPQIGFLRFLEFLASEMWNTAPIIVNFNAEMPREQVVGIENLFGTSRDSLPPLFIATPYDQKSMWTKKAPSKLILNRVHSLAKEASKMIELDLYSPSNWKSVFKPPLSGYDCLIHLKSEFNPRRYQSIDLDERFPKTSWHPYKFHTEQKLPVVDFNPVKLYLEELRSCYHEYALFFHDTYGGDVIGVLLNPSALAKRDFKVTNMNCRILDADKKLVLNVDALIEDFYVLGHNLVDRIDVQNTVKLNNK